MKFDRLMMTTAVLWGRVSSCKRRQVGVVISKEHRVLVNGYNGTIAGSDNNCEESVVCGDCKLARDNGILRGGCTACNDTGKTLKTLSTTLHAEANAIAYAAKDGIALRDTTMYITTSPCVECSKLIIQAGITKVIYLDTYKDTSGLDFLILSGIIVKQLGELEDE